MEKATWFEKMWVKTPPALVIFSSALLGALIALLTMPDFPWWGDVLMIITGFCISLYIGYRYTVLDTPRGKNPGYQGSAPAAIMLSACALGLIIIVMWSFAFAIQDNFPTVAEAMWCVPMWFIAGHFFYFGFYGGHFPSEEEKFRVWADGATKEPYSTTSLGKFLDHNPHHHVLVVTNHSLSRGEVHEYFAPTYRYTFPNGETYHEEGYSVSSPQYQGGPFKCIFNIISDNTNQKVIQFSRSVADEDILKQRITQPDP